MDDIMQKFINGPKEESKDLNDFLKNVDDIKSIIDGLSSKDENVSKKSVEKADKFLKTKEKGFGEEKIENAERKEEKTEKTKTFDRTVINQKAFKDEQENPANFMKSLEEDAKKRTEERKKRKAAAELLKIKGENLFNEGKYNEALEAFDKALSTFKDWPALWTGRALTYLQLGNVSKALDDCDWAFRSNEKSLNAHVAMYRIKMHQKKYHEAIEIMNKALEFHPSKKSLINKHIVEATLEQANSN